MSRGAPRQLLLTLGLGLGLSGLCWLYASALNPMLMPMQKLVSQSHDISRQLQLTRPREYVEMAQRFLDSQPWAAEADGMFASETKTTYFYTREITPVENDRAVELSPFALIWFPDGTKPDDEPITIACDKAYVRFSSPVNAVDFRPGRPVLASLEGGVTIEGPDGLLIKGPTFVFDEEPMHIRCDSTVRFRYRQNRGTARSLQIELLADEDLRRKDSFAVTGVQSFMLRSNVRMDLVSEDGEQVQIRSAGQFEYVLSEQVATFENDVRVYRPTGPEMYDSLQCDLLTLSFASSDSQQPTPEEGFAGMGGKLELRELRATGRNVTLESQENDLAAANLRELVYDLPGKTVAMVSDQLIEAQLQSTLLQCPTIRLLHDDDGRMVSARCSGPGRLVNYDSETTERVLSAGWQRELYKHPDPETGLDVIELEEQAIVQQHGSDAGLGAESIKLWYQELPDRQRGADEDSSRFRPVRLVAQNQVVLISSEMRAETNDLEVRFEAAHSRTSGSVTASTEPHSTPVQTTSASVQSDEPGAEEPLAVTADRIEVRVSQLDGLQDPRVEEIATFGRVVVTQARQDSAESLRLTGESLHMQNGSDQVVELRGEPAIVQTSEMGIEARNIKLDRANNLVEVDGRGLLMILSKRSLEGKELPEPQRLDIWWNEKMNFDGQTAQFYGDVDAKLQHSSLKCQEMRVDLTRPVSFSDEQPGQRDDVDVHKVFCRDGVTVKSDRYEGNVTKDIFRGGFYEFSLDQQTGKTEATGRGWINIWQRADDKRAPLGNGIGGQPNRPAQLQQTEWTYIRIEFDGSASGNIEQSHLEFKDGVRIISGGVAHPHETIDRDHLPLNAGWLRSRKLTIHRHDAPTGNATYHELVASDNVWMEGRTKNGVFTALADQISYDESKDTFILRSHKGQPAKIYREKRIGGTRDEFEGRRMQFSPSTNVVQIDEATGFQGQQ